MPCASGGERMRWFYLFLLAFLAWGGFVQVALKDDSHTWKPWQEPR